MCAYVVCVLLAKSLCSGQLAVMRDLIKQGLVQFREYGTAICKVAATSTFDVAVTCVSCSCILLLLLCVCPYVYLLPFSPALLLSDGPRYSLLGGRLLLALLLPDVRVMGSPFRCSYSFVCVCGSLVRPLKKKEEEAVES